MEQKNKVSLHQSIWYLLIFSIFGLLIETLYCFITTGVFESRKGLVLGPVCPIYGVGAFIIIIVLTRFNNSKLKLFIYGGILGSIIEYLVSFMLEAIYGNRFWDYSYMLYDLNGRISILYSVFWCVLSLLIVKFIKPLLDTLIAKIRIVWLDYLIIIFFIIDILVTVWGINTYIGRVVENKVHPSSNNFALTTIFWVEDNCFSNEIMSSIFPNLRAIDNYGNEVWVKDLIK